MLISVTVGGFEPRDALALIAEYYTFDVVEPRVEPIQCRVDAVECA